MRDLARRVDVTQAACSQRASQGRPAIDRSRALSKDERPVSDQEVVKDILGKLDLPASLKKQLRQRHDLEE